MLLLSSGPDTFRARRKAQELVAAFRAKYDPSGFSTELLQSSTLGDFLMRIGAPSLFAQRRLLRRDGLIESLKLAEVRQLAKRLEGDQESTIVLSVETTPLDAKLKKEFSQIKLIQYSHPLLSGEQFFNACLHRAAELGVSQKLAQEIAQRSEGDIWRAEQELQKISANPQAPLLESPEIFGGVFHAAEAYLTCREGWRALLSAQDADEAIAVFLTHARAALRVADRETHGIHPYTIKKLSALKLNESRARESLQRSIRALCAARHIATAREAEAFL